MNSCGVNNCGSRAVARGYCNLHYQKFHRYGNPTAGFIRNKNGKGSVSKSTGYRVIHSGKKQVLEHRLVAEKAIGHALPKTAIIHHVNGDKTDNRNINLVVCPDEKYHQLLHRRQDAINNSGDPDKRRCRHCGLYDDRDALYFPPGKDSGFHRSCRQKFRHSKDKYL